MASKLVYFVRHGEASYNVLDRVNSDPTVVNDLTATGREQAACCAEELAGDPLETIYCSEFSRTRQTAEIINRRHQAPIIVDPLLNETGAFAFDGLPTRLWHDAQVPDRLRAVVPGCEPFSEMKRRLRTFLDKLCGVPATRVAVVSHEEPIQVMVGLLQGVPDETALRRPISHCYPIVLEVDCGDENYDKGYGVKPSRRG